MLLLAERISYFVLNLLGDFRRFPHLRCNQDFTIYSQLIYFFILNLLFEVTVIHYDEEKKNYYIYFSNMSLVHVLTLTYFYLFPFFP